MKRDATGEWMRAIQRRMDVRQVRAMPKHIAAMPSPCGTGVEPAAIRRTQRLQARDWRQDLGIAIRVLQRHNRLLRTRFGVGWADAVSVVQGEASRRGMSAATLARVLVAGLRSDAAQGQA